MSTMPTAWESDEALTFDSLIGNAAAKRALFEHVVLPLKLSEETRGSLFGGWKYLVGHSEQHGYVAQASVPSFFTPRRNVHVGLAAF